MPTSGAARETPLGARSATVTIVAQLVARAITVAVVVASTAIVTRALGVGVYADWVTVLSLVAMLAFVLDPGLTPVIVRRLATEPAAVPTPGTLLRLRLGLAVAAVAVVTAIAAVLRGPEVIPLALVLAAQVVPRAVVLNAGAWLQADHRLHWQTVWEAVTAAGGLALLGLAASADASAVALAAVGFVAPACVLALVMLRELARTPSHSLIVPGPDRDRMRTLIQEVKPLALALLLIAVYARLHVIFVNVAEDSDGVARFLFAWQFVEQTYVIAGIVAATLLPLLAARGIVHDLRRDDATINLLVAVSALGALGTAVLIALAEPITTVIGGPRLAGAERDLTLLSPMAAIVVTAFQLGYIYLALGEGGRYLRFNVAALIFSLAGHLTLTLHYGADAAARVTWMTEVLVVALAFAPFWAGGPTGRLAGLRIAALIAVAIAGAELVAGGVLTAPVGAAMIAIAAVLIGGRRLIWLASTLRHGR